MRTWSAVAGLAVLAVAVSSVARHEPRERPHAPGPELPSDDRANGPRVAGPLASGSLGAVAADNLPPRVSRRASRVVAVLREPAGLLRADQLDLLETLLDDVEYRRTDAHFVRAASGDEMLLVATSDGICVASRGNLTCGRTADLRSGRLSGSEICSSDLGVGATRLFGVVPDGADAIEVELREGSIVREPIMHNVYSVELPGVPDRVRLVGRRASRWRSVGIPADLGPSLCGPFTAAPPAAN